MSENRCSCNALGASSVGRDSICIDTYRVTDSCRDKDCYENARVYLGSVGQDLVNRCGATVKVESAKILWTQLTVDPIRFNCGFYQVNARFYILVRLSACLGLGRAQEFCGIAVLDKGVVLYGGEGNVNIFRSEPESNRCTPWNGSIRSTNTPIGVVETVEPVVLGSTVVEACDNCCACYCCCSCKDVPDDLLDGCGIDGLVDEDDGNRLYVSLGLFSVFRIERPAQLLLGNATPYSVPEKECAPADTGNPCALFRNMAFPTGEFTGDTCCTDTDTRTRK